MIIFLAAFVLLFSSHPEAASAAEKGYDEAMEYFVFREKEKAQKAKAVASPTSVVDRPDNIIIDPEKYFVGIGVGEVFGGEHYALELGVTLLQTKYFQQSLHLEYIHFNNENSPEFLNGAIQNSYGQGLFLIHNVQLSSQLFYLGPEISAGVGRVFDSPQKGALLVMKAGLAFSNRWSQRLLFSAHLYYRRSQYFKKDYHGDGLGLTLRFGF